MNSASSFRDSPHDEVVEELVDGPDSALVGQFELELFDVEGPESPLDGPFTIELFDVDGPDMAALFLISFGLPGFLKCSSCPLFNGA